MVLSVVSLNLCSFLAQEQFYPIRYQFLESLATTDLNDFFFFFLENTITWGKFSWAAPVDRKQLCPGRDGYGFTFLCAKQVFCIRIWFCWQKWASKICVLLGLEVMGAWPGTGCPLVRCCPQPVLCGPRVPSTDAEPCDWCGPFNLYLN